MQRFFRNLPIRVKLTVSILAASFLVLVLFGSVFLAVEIHAFRKSTINEVSVLASVLSITATKDLMLKRHRAAITTLDSLEAQPHIRAAFLFDTSGKPQAQYLDRTAMKFIKRSIKSDFAGTPFAPGNSPATALYFSDWSHLGMFKPIFFQGEAVGAIYLLSDMRDLITRFHALMFGFLLALGAVVPFSILLSRYLTRPIAQPVLSLLGKMHDISTKKNFAVRAEKQGSDEVGQLVDAFNDMLTQIEIRDSKLADHQQFLEEKVSSRTQLLQETVAKLENAKLEAESANQAKSQFLANMTHELRTPLIGVLGMNELLTRTELNERQMSLVDTVQRSGENLLALISDILDFSKIEAGYLHLDNVDIDIGKTVEDATHILAERAYAKGISLNTHIMPDALWKVRTDPSRLRQILLNLVGNALKFTETGGITVQLDMQMIGPGLGRFALAVTDTGVGINETDQADIFSAFVQSDNSTTRRHGGTGLGLAIVNQLVALMGGTIGLESQAGKGSTFTVELKLPLVSKQVPKLPDALRGRRVLVLQEDVDSQRVLKSMLAALELQVVAASSSEDAWYRLLADERQEFPFDFAVVPHGAVLRDGSLLSAKLRKEPQLSILRVITTGYRFVAVEERATELPELDRPITWENLTNCLIRSWQKIELVPNSNSVSKKAAGQPVAVVNEQEHENLPHRVLLADDNAVTRELICLSLANVPLDIDVVGTGVEALEALETAKYDLILMDCNMPELDGIEATRQLRQRGCQIPVIALTAHVDRRVYDRFSRAGGNDTLRKPFRQNELLAVIGKWLDIDSAQQRPGAQQASELCGGDR